MCTVLQSTRHLRAISPPSLSTAPFLSLIQRVDISSSRSFTQVYGLGKNDLDSSQNGKLRKKLLPSLDAFPLRSNLNKLLSRERVCLIPLKFTCLIFQILWSKVQSFSFLSKLVWRLKSLEIEFSKQQSQKCWCSIFMMTGRNLYKVLHVLHDLFWFFERCICIQNAPRLFWLLTRQLLLSLTTFGRR